MAQALDSYQDCRSHCRRRHVHVSPAPPPWAAPLTEPVHRTVATVYLVAFLYYVLATELVKLLKPEEEEDEFQPLRAAVSLVCRAFLACRPPLIVQAPGMGMTYIYEPTEGGFVRPTGNMPVKAPAHRLTTSLDSHYAS